MSRFLRILILATVVVHVPITLAVVRFAERLRAPSPWLIGLAFSVAGVLLFVGRARAGMPDRRRSEALIRLVDIPYFIHWCAGLFLIVPAVIATLVLPIVDLARGVPVTLPWDVYMWSYALGLLISGYGILVRRRWFVVKEVEVALAGLDPSFDGYRIAHLSDLHIGAVTPRPWGERWMRASNARSPDLVVVTGDMVTSGTEFHEDIADVVGQLRGKDGVFVSMGNHDYFGEGEPLITLLGARGARVLRNEGVVLTRGGARVWLAAIDDTWTKRDDLGEALRHRPQSAGRDMTTILLAHDPNRFPAAAKRGVSLTLSGHTHGGQVAMPFLYRWISLGRLAHPFNVGLYTDGDAKLYVHPGLGTTGPPIRLGVAPAVVMITLRAA
jgi:predicted MPP superfamily phosphohydrolase